MSGTEWRIDETELLTLSKELIRIPSVFTKEDEISKFVLSKFEDWGFSPKALPVEGHGPCVVVQTGDPELPSIVFNGHMDTVEVMEGWIHDPFGAVVEDGRLYGLGALDMKCGLAAMMLAFRELSSSDKLRGHSLKFQAVTGEELSGGGTRAAIANGELDTAKAVIVGEGFGGLRAVTNGRRGGSYFDFEVRGKAAHGAAPHLGVNAVVDASRLICELERMPMATTEGIMADDFSPLRESQTVLRIAGGGASLSVPDKCTVRLVRCTIPGGKVDVTDDMRAVVESAGLKSEVEVRFNDAPVDLYHPFRTDSGSPLVVAAVESLEEHTGVRPALVCGVSEADDNIIARELGLPVICVGPGESGELARYHKPEECVTVSQLPTAAKVYCSIVERLCGA
ncbi:TPA: M20 family metallopeptidase [Thermoplasmata archaeon]|nr:M20 family metallopeptidase [Thermoplasmata archaeon]